MLKCSHEFLYNPWTIKSDIFCFLSFFFLKRALLFHNISVRKSPKMTIENDALVQGWSISKMFSPLAEDHATLGWSADGWVPLQPQYHFDILHLSQRSVHSGGKTRCLCPPLPSRCAPPVPTDTSRKQKPTLSLIHGCFPPEASSLSARQQSVCQSNLPSTLCVSSFCVVVFYSALPLYKSTVAPGQSLGIGKREGFVGV